MVKLKTSIKAFTILESMVAIVIVMIVFGLTSVIIINISSSGITHQKIAAYSLVNTLRNETLMHSRFIDETIISNELRIEKTIIDDAHSQQLKIVLIEAYYDNQKLAESKELIILKTVVK